MSNNVVNSYRYAGEKFVDTKSDFINDSNYWVENVQFYTTGGYKFGSNHVLIGEEITKVEIVLMYINASYVDNSSSVYVYDDSAGSSVLIGSVDNDTLPASTEINTYSSFSGDNTHVMAADDIIFFQNNGSGGTDFTTGLRAGRWDNPSGGYVVPNNIWSEYGDTETCYFNGASGGDGVPPPVVGTAVSGGKAIGMVVYYS